MIFQGFYRGLAGSALIFAAACSPEIPDSNPRGAGFKTPAQYEAERQRRELELQGQRRAAIATEAGEDEVIAADTLAVLGATPATGGDGPVYQDPGNAEISDEQNFDAVASRETIESDADRIARNQQTYQVAGVEAVPERPGGGGPNIVAYALQTTNPVGAAMYARSGRANEAKYRRACAEFGSADQAQIAFLEAGGPKRDRKGLDPDGDGFACFWNPQPFRAARGG